MRSLRTLQTDTPSPAQPRRCCSIVPPAALHWGAPSQAPIPDLAQLQGAEPQLAPAPAKQPPIPLHPPLPPAQAPIPELAQLRQGPGWHQHLLHVPAESTVPLPAAPGAAALDIELTLDRWAGRVVPHVHWPCFAVCCAALGFGVASSAGSAYCATACVALWTSGWRWTGRVAKPARPLQLFWADGPCTRGMTSLVCCCVPATTCTALLGFSLTQRVPRHHTACAGAPHLRQGCCSAHTRRRQVRLADGSDLPDLLGIPFKASKLPRAPFYQLPRASCHMPLCPATPPCRGRHRDHLRLGAQHAGSHLQCATQLASRPTGMCVGACAWQRLVTEAVWHVHARCKPSSACRPTGGVVSVWESVPLSSGVVVRESVGC